MSGLQNPSVLELVSWPAIKTGPVVLGPRVGELLYWILQMRRFSEALECLTLFCGVGILTKLPVL